MLDHRLPVKASGPIAGFSLVELMVVVAITAVLVSIAVPQFKNYTWRARRAEVKATFAHVAGQLAAWEGEGQAWGGADWNDAQIRQFAMISDTTRYSYGLLEVSSTSTPTLTAVYRTGDPATRDEHMAVPLGPQCLCTDGSTGELVPFTACGNQVANMIGQDYGFGLVRTITVSKFTNHCMTGNID